MSVTEQQLEALQRGPLHSFADWPDPDMPRAAAGVYSIWNKQKEFVYVGMAGRLKTVEQLRLAGEQGRITGLMQRLKSHASGARSGDQFCIYAQDHLVLPELTLEHIDQIVTRQLVLDRLVRDYVRENLSYRYVVTKDGPAASALERVIINGAFGNHPLLNPPSRLR
jgi:hypothetical protein